MTPTQLWWRLVPAYASGYFLSYALRNVNAVISPELSAQFALSDAQLGLLTSAYFLGFGAIQLPLGMLLDRFGPRRVEQVLLLVAAAGCALFASAAHWQQLVVARAAIGLGVSACLMASFKAFSQWFHVDRLPALNATIMMAGGLGALTASAPVAWLLPLLGWRGVFWLFAALLTLSAWGLSLALDRQANAGHATQNQWHILGRIYRSAAFWRYAPQGMVIAGGMMAVQGLWLVPWLMTVNDFSRSQAAQVASYTALAMLLGHTIIATLSPWLARHGWPPMRLLKTGVALGLLSELGLLTQSLPPTLAWMGFGLFFSATNVAYSQLSRAFELSWSGRVNTALNLVVFVGAFALQWGLGGLSEWWQAAGQDAAHALIYSLAGLWIAQCLAFGWFVRPEPAGDRGSAA